MATGFLLVNIGQAFDLPVVATKLIVVDKLVASGRAKVAFVAKDPCCSSANPDRISVRLEVRYGNDNVDGTFEIPAGAANGWLDARPGVSKFVNREAPAGPTEAKLAIVKGGRVMKLVGKGLGDTDIDILNGGDPAGPVYTAYCTTIFGQIDCHCSGFTGCVWKAIAGGTGAKLLCKDGTGDPTCQGDSRGPLCGDRMVEAPETCDPPHECPTCDDGDACTTDSFTGSAATCDVVCVNDPITTCQDGDGCCPAGCDSGNDDDCISCFVDLGQTVLDTCTNLEWEKKDGADATPGSGTADPGNPHDVDNRYAWVGKCTVSLALCQPNAAAAAACAAQTGGTPGCAECGMGEGTCDPVPPSITTVWDWVSQLNAASFAGHSDWRLATTAGTAVLSTGAPPELESIVDTSYSPTIDPIFGPTVAGDYWSGSDIPTLLGFAYSVTFDDGTLSGGVMEEDFSVRAVRPGS